MMNLLKILLPVALGLCLSNPSYATGPRVSPSLISNDHDIYTVKLPPFINPDGLHNCYLGKIINEVLEQEKIGAMITPLPLARMVNYYLLKDHAFAALNPYLDLTEEEQEGLQEISLDTVAEHYIFYKPAHPDGLTWEGDLNKLKGLTYGAVKGENVDQFRSAGIEVKTMRFDNLLTQLVSGKVDFIRLPEASLHWLIDQKYSDNKQDFAKMAVEAGKREFAILFNKNHEAGPGAAAKFQQGLNRLIQTGRFEQIKQQILKNDP